MTQISSLEALRSTLDTLDGHITSAKFAQGDALVLAVQKLDQLGVSSQNELLRSIGKYSRATLMTRLKVSRTFAPDERHHAVEWGVYVEAAKTNTPLAWVEYAMDHALSPSKLKTAIKATGGEDPDTVRIVFPLRNVVVVQVEAWPNAVKFVLAEPLTAEQIDQLRTGAGLQLSVSVEIGKGDND